MVQDQLITQVDENDNFIGLKPRSDFNDGKLIHRSSYLLVFNSKRQTLLQKRLLTKKWHAGKWTFPVAGTVGNETYEECMKKQIKEALGIELPFKKLFKYHHFDNVDKAFKTVFVVNAEQNQLALNKNYAEDFA